MKMQKPQKNFTIIYRDITRINSWKSYPPAPDLSAFTRLIKFFELVIHIHLTNSGTGKTYLSAFDVANVKPQKMLFLVHREQILKQAMESFKDVLGEGIKAGLLSGTTKN